MSFAHEIEIFTVTSLPIEQDEQNAKICLMDEVKLFEHSLSAVSDNPKKIEAMVQENEGRLIASMECQYLADVYGIKKLPAIVIDKEYVAYGLHSVTKALDVLHDKGRAHA